MQVMHGLASHASAEPLMEPFIAGHDFARMWIIAIRKAVGLPLIFVHEIGELAMVKRGAQQVGLVWRVGNMVFVCQPWQ